MAVDNFNRTDSFNAIVEAWTRYGSLPFVTRKLINGGETATFSISHPFEGFVLFIGMAAAVVGLYTIRVTVAGTAAYIGTIKAGSSLAVTWTTGTITINNNATQNTYAYIVALNGSVEEV